MSKQLPARPLLKNLQHQAKRLLKGHRERKPTVVRRLRAHLGRFSAATTAEIVQAPVTLRDAQEVIAREYGFDKWADLKRHVETITGQAPTSDDPADELALLLQAMEAGDVALVEAHLKQNPALANTPVEGNDTLLHRAEIVGRGRREGDERDLQIAQSFIDYGADIDAFGGWGDRAQTTPLDAATWTGNIEMVQLLLTNGADPNKAYPGMPAPVGTATSHGRKEIFLLLIGAGADYTLEHTIQLGLLKETRALLDAEPDLINEPLPDGHMPLTLGAGQQGMFKLLLRRGADIHRRAPNGFTPLLTARAANNQKAVDELLALGVAEDIFGAILQRDTAKVKAILRANPRQAHALEGGPVPLLWAVIMGSRPIVELLLAQGVEVNIWRYGPTEGNPRTPLIAALSYHYDDIAHMLLEHGAHPAPDLKAMKAFAGWPQDREEFRDRVLTWALRNGTIRGVELLLDRGVPIGGFWGNPVKAKLLLDRGLDLRRPENIRTLFQVIEAGDLISIELLVCHGADLKGRAPNGRPLLDVLARKRRPSLRALADDFAAWQQRPAAEAEGILELRRRFIDAVIDGKADQVRGLLERDPALLNRQVAWDVLFHFAVDRGDQDLVDVLVEYGAPWTMNAAARLGRLEVVKRLLEEDPSRLDAGPSTPLMAATIGDQVAVVEYLLDQGADIDRQTPRGPGNTGRTALHEGVLAKSINALEVLLERGADIHISNDSGWTPFMYISDIDSPIRALFMAYGVRPEEFSSRFKRQAPRKNRKDRR
ncbi:MAG: hypothetical protein GKR89_36395 [Candidatus Latescibacteria bacterium]|nr:hypothetical protein [Candidatus Latescibacterota bacterium]